MNCRWGVLFLVLLAGVAISVALLPVRPVEAGSSLSSPLLPARFFSELPVPKMPDFALQAGASSKRAEDAALPDGKGKELAQKYCNTCHVASVWTTKHHTRDQWSSVMDEMVSKGLNAPDADLDTITDYLVANFGPKTAPQPVTPDAPAPSPTQ